MVKKSLLDRFIKLGGYDAVQFKNERWRGIGEAAKKTGLSVMTVRRILKEYSEPPKKGQPKYVEEFEKSEGYQNYKAKYGRKTQFRDHAMLIRRAWLILNKKDPVSWSKQDYEKIWNHPKFVHPDLNAVPERVATAFHNLMRSVNRHEFLLAFKGTKFAKGKKREWFLEDEDIIALTGSFEENESLVMSLLGIVKGARFSALVKGKPEHLNRKDLIMLDFEPKTKQYVTRFIPKSVMELLQQYIRDYDIQPEERLFKQGYTFYLRQFRTAGKKAKLRKTISTHILKHTFVTQGSRHGVSAEIISDQTGTELRTLTAHYRAKNVKKARHELLGEKTDIVPFSDWINSLMPYFKENYERIKRSGAKVDGIRSKL